MAKWDVLTHQCLIEGNIFETFSGWQAAHLAIDFRAYGHAAGKVLMMTWPGIVRLRVAGIFQPGDQQTIAVVALLHVFGSIIQCL